MSATAARLFAWLQDAAFYREMHLDAGINQLADIVPVFQVPGATINLVDNDAAGDPKPQKAQHLIERWPSLLGSAFLFLEPPDDFQPVPFGIA